VILTTSLDTEHRSKKARIHVISKDDVLLALKAFKDPKDCQHNSFREEEELTDETMVTAQVCICPFM